MNNATGKLDKMMNNMAAKNTKKCPTSTKSRPPLTDRTNIFNQKYYQHTSDNGITGKVSITR
jgi:hypothetical protein